MFRTQHSRKIIESLISLSKHRQVEGVANMAHPSTPSRFSEQVAFFRKPEKKTSFTRPLHQFSHPHSFEIQRDSLCFQNRHTDKFDNVAMRDL